MRSGTGASIHAKGFNVPAAGKTGTSRDGWFAGFTSNLICVVWVGFDDNSDLDLEGAKSALPIWTEFMKRAAQNAQYALPFEGVPSGIVSLQIDPESGDLASPQCPSTRAEYFIAGSEPQTVCALHNGTLVSAESEGEAARLEVAGKPEVGVSQQTGMACYFSPGANGGLTASGARLSGEELVAAHATYPLGSHVKVTNLANRKTIEVRIVDRFPATNRVINVSEAAAKLLDFVKAGTAEVRLELMR
jgi:membrane carboxypeptidase/penicillin-binding protein PbpC